MRWVEMEGTANVAVDQVAGGPCQLGILNGGKMRGGGGGEAEGGDGDGLCP